MLVPCLTGKEGKNTMLGISERIEDTLNELEFRVVGSSIQKGEYVTEVQFYSDAGDDYIMTIWHDGTEPGFIHSFKLYADIFDVNEYVRMYISCMGKNGVPGTIQELLDDANMIEDTMENAAVMLMTLIDENEVEPEPAEEGPPAEAEPMYVYVITGNSKDELGTDLEWLVEIFRTEESAKQACEQLQRDADQAESELSCDHVAYCVEQRIVH